MNTKTKKNKMPTRVFFNTDTPCFSYGTRKPTGEEWVVLPELVGIIWHGSDQSNNEIVLDKRRVDKAHYVFNPASDTALLEEYIDQLEDLLR